MDEHHAEVAVATLGDASQTSRLTGGVLPGRETEVGGKVASRIGRRFTKVRDSANSIVRVRNAEAVRGTVVHTADKGTRSDSPGIGESTCDIFLSYASEDRERVRPLVALFESHGWSVWWDREIPKGREWADAIEEAISESRVMVVVWTVHSTKSDWVRLEARAGKSKPGGLVPIRLDSGESRLEFSGLQEADLTNWDGSDAHPEVQSTIAALEAILGAPGARSAPSEEGS